MDLRSEVLALRHLGDDEAIARQLFESQGLDLDDLITELNTRAPELGAGTMLMRGVLETVQIHIRTAPALHTPLGPVRSETYNRFIAESVADIRQATTNLYKQNAERTKRGLFTNIMQRTVADLQGLILSYRKLERSYNDKAAALEWLVDTAKSRGLGDTDKIGMAFTEEELEAMYQTKKPLPQPVHQEVMTFGEPTAAR